VSCC